MIENGSEEKTLYYSYMWFYMYSYIDQCECHPQAKRLKDGQYKSPKIKVSEKVFNVDWRYNLKGYVESRHYTNEKNELKIKKTYYCHKCDRKYNSFAYDVNWEVWEFF